MESKPLVVVGAGVSGTAAAIEAAKVGVQVTLIDENPIGTSMMGLDVLQFFGLRIMSTLGNKAVMLGRVAGPDGGGGSRRRHPAWDVCLGGICLGGHSSLGGTSAGVAPTVSIKDGDEIRYREPRSGAIWG